MLLHLANLQHRAYVTTIRVRVMLYDTLLSYKPLNLGLPLGVFLLNYVAAIDISVLSGVWIGSEALQNECIFVRVVTGHLSRQKVTGSSFYLDTDIQQRLSETLVFLKRVRAKTMQDRKCQTDCSLVSGWMRETEAFVGDFARGFWRNSWDC